MGKGQDLYKKAKRLIPGGTQLLSKRPEMFLPEQWPAYYDRSKGCEVWDLDGNHYYDMCYMGIGACILGYSYESVNRAAQEAIERGSMNTLNAPEEVELAERMVRLHPWAGMVRYARTGGEAMAIAVRIARAKTRKDVVLFCGYHGWHDWYVAANLAEDRALDGHLLPGLSPVGVPRSLRCTSFPFKYGDAASLRTLTGQYGEDTAAIVLESIRNDEPTAEFVNAVRDEADRTGAVLIVDEITAGLRLNLGGAHLLYGFDPDMAVFGKAISNGFPLGVIIGKTAVMQAAQDTFISSTYWTDRVGPAAALATLQEVERQGVIPHLSAVGNRIRKGWKQSADRHALEISVGGIPPLSHFTFGGEDSLLCKTLFTQMMLERGFLASTACYASYAHREEIVDAYLAQADAVFSAISQARAENTVAALVKGPVCHSGFKRLV